MLKPPRAAAGSALPGPRRPDDAPDVDADGPTAAEAAAHERALRDATRLGAEVTSGLAALVETLQARLPAAPVATLPGLAYKTVRGTRRLVGDSIDTLLAALTPLLRAGDDATAAPGAASPAKSASTPEHAEAEASATLPGPDREALVAALNGVLGDQLAHGAHRLAVPMAWRRGGRVLPASRAGLAAALPDAGGKLLVLIHGLGMNDLQWRRPAFAGADADANAGADASVGSAEVPDASGPTKEADHDAHHDHGEALAAALGFTPVYLHYNTGLHVSTNGRALATRLERLLHDWPRPLARFAVVAHGSGGLLARSALHHGRAAGHHWTHRLDDLACLGTPHHGAPLEPLGAALDALAGIACAAGPFARLVKLRSAGLTDQGHANLLDEDWIGGDRLVRVTDRRVPVPLPTGPRCHAAAATLAPDGDDGGRRQPAGDGIVPLASALGRHRLARRTLKFPPQHQRTFAGTSHLQLLSSEDVFEQLRRWLAH